VSQKTRQIAQLFKEYKRQRATADSANLAEKKILDEGFRRMRVDLEKFIPVFCEELNQEPEIGNILECGSNDDRITVTCQDTGETLSVNFDEILHKVIFSCNKPVKVRESVEVKAINVTGWWFADKDGGSAGAGDDSVSWMAEKAIKALLGIPA